MSAGWPDDRIVTLSPGQPIPAELINAHSDAIRYHTHGTVTQRYKVSDRRAITGSWVVGNTDANDIGSISEATNGNTCQIDVTSPLNGSIVTAVSMKVKDAGASATLTFTLYASLDDGTTSTTLATLVSSGAGALEIVSQSINYTVPASGITTSNTRLHAIVATSGGGAGSRRLYEFSLTFYRP